LKTCNRVDDRKLLDLTRGAPAELSERGAHLAKGAEIGASRLCSKPS
jgi:hypothetical protein